MTNTKLLLLAIIAIVCVAIILKTQPHNFGSATSGLSATIATTSNPTVGTSPASPVVATSTCTSRIISTLASPIMIGFSDVQGFVPTALIGHPQAASTTVAYDSGLYGCGAVRIYSFAASTITVSETR